MTEDTEAVVEKRIAEAAAQARREGLKLGYQVAVRKLRNEAGFTDADDSPEAGDSREAGDTAVPAPVTQPHDYGDGRTFPLAALMFAGAGVPPEPEGEPEPGSLEWAVRNMNIRGAPVHRRNPENVTGTHSRNPEPKPQAPTTIKLAEGD